jgi:hypothetical protein
VDANLILQPNALSLKHPIPYLHSKSHQTIRVAFM